MPAFYNEIDPFAAQWLRNLSAAGRVAAGVVDDRSIKELTPEDVRGATQAHFFAGIGVWSYALRAAGVTDDVRVWTGSCPCQPFSSAGKGAGFADERHLWPDWFKLIDACRPELIFGEQVASKDGLAWLDLVSSDLEGAGYAVRAADTCAAGFGAPHIRQRLYWMAYANEAGLGIKRSGGLFDGERSTFRNDIDGCGTHGGLAYAGSDEFGAWRASEESSGAGSPWQQSAGLRNASGLGHTDHEGLQGNGRLVGQHDPERREGAQRHDPEASFWGDAEWIQCRDGKSRPAKPGIFPLATRAPSRVGKLCAAGNALCAPQAIGFIQASLESLP